MEYKHTISKNSLEKWKSVFNTSLRKKLLLSYINKIDDYIVDVQGYNKKDLVSSVRELNINGNFGILMDLFDLIYSETVFRLKLNIFFVRALNWIKGITLS